MHTLLFKRRKNHEKVRETYCKELTRLRLVQIGFDVQCQRGGQNKFGLPSQKF